MRIWLPIGLGALLILMGGTWTLQGLGYVGGSFMSGAKEWFWIGLATLAVGLVLAAMPLLRRR
ncbi:MULTISPECIES: hypothetical protein [Streptosporangium]|uniref:DUF3995 domain-containing protein n=1 Tax=Streptosporangium brasiliense TaxID=47480 RepID=A0ABT9R9J6_9ACTN|nr:hypothetical protein [Streptosporangium brasiliense]MDP9865920.1 hypothetical protein [Streptosporangium brasiliense]